MRVATKALLVPPLREATDRRINARTGGNQEFVGLMPWQRTQVQRQFQVPETGNRHLFMLAAGSRQPKGTAVGTRWTGYSRVEDGRVVELQQPRGAQGTAGMKCLEMKQHCTPKFPQCPAISLPHILC